MSPKIYLADMTNGRSYLFSLSLLTTLKIPGAVKSRELSPLGKRIILQALSCVFISRATNRVAFCFFNKISLFISIVLTLGGRSYLDAFVTEENAVPLSLPASSPAPPWLTLLLLTWLIADRVFAHPLDYPEKDC